MAISTADFRNGMCIEYKDKLWVIIEFQHVKPGKGGAFVRTKLRDIRSGRVVDYTFNPTDKFENAIVERKEMQYLYNDGDLYYFMDMETFEQLPINKDKLGDYLHSLLKENDDVQDRVLQAGNVLIAVEPPMFVVLEVTDTEPGFKGDTATRYHQARDSRDRRDHQGSASSSTMAISCASIRAMAAMLLASNLCFDNENTFDCEARKAPRVV